jgi:hypothetical protein
MVVSSNTMAIRILRVTKKFEERLHLPTEAPPWLKITRALDGFSPNVKGSRF